MMLSPDLQREDYGRIYYITLVLFNTLIFPLLTVLLLEAISIIVCYADRIINVFHIH